MMLSTHRILRSLYLVCLAAFLAACLAPPATPQTIYVTATPGPVGITIGTLTSAAPVIPFNTPVPTLLPPSVTPTPTRPPFKTLTVCLPTEPQSLYQHSSGDRDSLWARNILLDTLSDGPIDHRNFEYLPVIVEKLPSLKDGDAVSQPVRVNNGEPIVDATGNLSVLTKDLHYFDASGSELVYDGRGTVEAMQLSATFKLKAGIKWEDGTPLTADDVLFAWQIAKDPHNLASDHYLTNRALDPVVVDARTLQITFLPGFKDTLYYTRLPLPYPRHLYGKLTVAEMATDAGVNRKPVSFGPFRFKEWVAGDHITVVKNANYFRAAEGLPVLDQIVFRFVPDAGQMVQAARGGRCDVALPPPSQDSFFTAQAETIDTSVTRGAFKVQSVSSTSFEHLDFNISPVEDYAGFAKNKLFEKVKVRQAFAHCLNRRALVDTLLRGRGEVTDVYVPPNHPFYDPNLVARYTFDPEKGRALLQEAGWTDSNGNGVLDRRGVALSLDYVFGPTGNILRQSLVALVEAQLKQNCGIEIKPRALSLPDLFSLFPDGALFGRQYDLAQFAWVGGEADPSCSHYTRNAWTGLGDGQPDQFGLVGYPTGGNNVGYINPAFDEACLRGLGSLDPLEKKGYHQQALKLFSQEIPSIILFFKPRIALVHPTVAGFSLDSMQDSALWNAEAIDLKP